MKERFDGARMGDSDPDPEMLAKIKDRFVKPAKLPGTTVAERKRSEGEKIDGRTLRATGRTELFSARVTEATKAALHDYAREHDILLGEVLERAVVALLGKKR